MTDQEEIDYLKTHPPVVPLTRWDRVERWIGWATAAIAVAALTLAIIVGLSGVATANCINTNLGTRSAPSASDAQAHIAFANAVLALFDPAGSPASRGEAFKVAATKYKASLVADQDARNATPLGKC